jgi:glycosyltransferase involved in cell wall biosynthesis
MADARKGSGAYMRIGIDASRLRAGMSGIGRYIYNILQPLNEVLPEATFILYTRADFGGTLPSDRWSLRRDNHPLWSRLPTLYWTRYRLGALACRDRLDGFWATNTLLPNGMRSVPCVATFYDLNQILAPETMTLLTRWAYRRWFAQAVKDAACRVAISQGTSSRLEGVFGCFADAVARPAVPKLAPLPTKDEAEQLIGKVGIRQPYILTVGTLEPRKNLMTVVSAVTRLKSEGKLVDHQLAMVGARGWGTALHRKDGGHEAWLSVPGYVDDKTLVALYMLADVFVFPSLYEGYGIPVGEAVAYGCRTVATEMPELREAGGEEVTYIQPTLEGVTQGIELALAMPKPQPRHAAHDWKDAAMVMADTFRAIARPVG